MTAALYASRAGKKVMLLEENAFGGQIATAPRVENFPSVEEIAGAQLAEKMFNQVVSQGVDFDMGKGVVEKTSDGFCVNTEYGEFPCKAVVLATGVSHKTLGLESEKRLAENGVCYCAVCDGAFYKGKNVCVVGDGNSAAQYALYLAEICNQVHLLTLFDRLFCDSTLTQRIVAKKNIVWVKNVSVCDIVGDEKVQGVAYRDNDGAITYADTDAVFGDRPPASQRWFFQPCATGRKRLHCGVGRLQNFLRRHFCRRRLPSEGRQTVRHSGGRRRSSGIQCGNVRRFSQKLTKTHP